jgi:hypothetical protein
MTADAVTAGAVMAGAGCAGAVTTESVTADSVAAGLGHSRARPQSALWPLSLVSGR